MNEANKTVVESVLGSIDLRKPATVTAAAARLTEAVVKVGDKVAVTGDPTFPVDGQTGVVKKLNPTSGTADVEFASGQTVPLQTNLLIIVK